MKKLIAKIVRHFARTRDLKRTRGVVHTKRWTSLEKDAKTLLNIAKKDRDVLLEYRLTKGGKFPMPKGLTEFVPEQIVDDLTLEDLVRIEGGVIERLNGDVGGLPVIEGSYREKLLQEELKYVRELMMERYNNIVPIKK